MSIYQAKDIKGKVFFIGAGPGAPDLITLRGAQIIKSADLIVYAGSLVNGKLFEDCRVPLYDSSTMHLDEIVELMVKTCRKGGTVARVHTGDPSLYGAIKEQMLLLEENNIDHQMVPGVTSAFGAAASLGVELTLPEVTQSVIITRRAGRTPVPEAETLDKLAAHGATMMIFLSVSMIDNVVSELIAGGYSEDTPVSVIMRATWPDEKIVRGSLTTISEKVKREKITKTAMICVGEVFGEDAFKFASKLYDKDFSHSLRDDKKTINLETDKSTMDTAERNKFEELLAESVNFHGHLCAGQVIGVRMSMLGLKLIGIEDPQGDDRKKVYVIVEIDRCATDAIQSVTGCRLGKRSMHFKDFGIMAATFVNLETSEAVRIVAREESRTLAKNYASDILDKYEQQLQAYKIMSNEELFTVCKVELSIPQTDLPGRPLSRVRCDKCGEWVQDGREIKIDDTVLCKSCNGNKYYRIVEAADVRNGSN